MAATLRLLTVVLVFTFLVNGLYSQNVTITDDASHEADASAMLDVYSLNKGLLVPRLELVSADNPISGTKSAGLLVWNTLAGTYSVGYHYWDGTAWSPIGAKAGNGLTKTGDKVEFGGTLEKSTTLTTSGYELKFDVNGTNSMAINLGSTGDFYIYDENSSFSLFTFQDNGYVGIGTSSPEHQLHLRGYNANTAGTDGVFVDVQNRYTGAGMSGIRFANNSLGGTDFRAGIFYRRTNSPSSVDGDLLIANATNKTVDYNDAAIVVKPDKKVGFGTSSPTAKVHVNGDARLSLGVAVNEFSSDGTLVGNSDLAVPTEKAVKTYVDGRSGSGFSGSGTKYYLPLYTGTTTLGNSLLYQSSNKIGIGTTAPTSKLVVYGNNGGADSVPIFEVKNDAGQTVFAVYPKGVQISVAEEVQKGTGSKTGFAVGGLSTGKVTTQEYLRVSGDSVRIYVNDAATNKGVKSGFAVGGFTTGKGNAQNLLHLVKENYFIGHNSGTKSTGNYNNFFGYEAGRENVGGVSNVFLGYWAGAANTEGDNNIAIGNVAGWFNQTGNSNISIGLGAGAYLKNGDNNICIGNYAGIGNFSISGAANNTVIGVKAGQGLTTAKGNTLIGYNAGNDLTTGLSNICFGDSAGYQMTTASNNIIIGAGAGVKTNNQPENTYVGYKSGISMNGNRNTFIGSRTGGTGNVTATAGTGYRNAVLGYYGLYNLTTGYQNTTMGCYSGWNVSTGYSNTMLGYYAGGSNNGNSNVFVGNYAGYSESGSNRLYIENAITDKTSSLIYGEFDNNILRFNGGVGINDDASSAYGLKVLKNNTSGTNYGVYSVSNGATSSYNYGIYGYASSSTSQNRGGYFYGYGSGTSTVNYGIYSTSYGGTSSINYGIYCSASGGTSSTNYAGYFSGNINVTGSVLKASDIRVKKNVSTITGALEKLDKIKGIYFEYDQVKYEEFNKNLNSKTSVDGEPFEKEVLPTDLQIGVVAQEIEAILPQSVKTDGNGLKSVDYQSLIPLLIQAIKEQQLEIEQLQKQVGLKPANE